MTHIYLFNPQGLINILPFINAHKHCGEGRDRDKEKQIIKYFI